MSIAYIHYRGRISHIYKYFDALGRQSNPVGQLDVLNSNTDVQVIDKYV